MATAARLPLAAWRNELCVRTIRFVGLDLTGVDMRMQVRLRPNSPTALFSLATVTSSSAEGLKLDSVVTTDGIPTSAVSLRINKTTMADATKVPYSGEPDTDTPLSYAIQLGGTSVGATRVYGQFIALATVMDSDAAPVGGIPAGYGSAGSSVPLWSAAQVTFSNDDITVSIDGIDLLAPLITRATEAAEAAEDAQVTVAAAQAIATAAAASGAQTLADAQALAASIVTATVGDISALVSFLPTVAALRALTSTFTLTIANVQSYSAGWAAVTATGGQPYGGGTFVRDASDTTSADNGGTIIVDAAGRRWKRVLSRPNWVSVADFGIVGDGTTDQRVALNAMFVVAAAKGLNVEFPAGTWMVSSAAGGGVTNGLRVLVPNNGSMVIQGAGMRKTIIKRVASATMVTNSAVIKMAANSGVQIEWRDLTIDGNEENIPFDGTNDTTLYQYEQSANLKWETGTFVSGTTAPPERIMFDRVGMQGCVADGYQANIHTNYCEVNKCWSADRVRRRRSCWQWSRIPLKQLTISDSDIWAIETEPSSSSVGHRFQITNTIARSVLDIAGDTNSSPNPNNTCNLYMRDVHHLGMKDTLGWRYVSFYYCRGEASGCTFVGVSRDQRNYMTFNACTFTTVGTRADATVSDSLQIFNGSTSGIDGTFTKYVDCNWFTDAGVVTGSHILNSSAQSNRLRSTRFIRCSSDAVLAYFADLSRPGLIEISGGALKAATAIIRLTNTDGFVADLTVSSPEAWQAPALINMFAAFQSSDTVVALSGTINAEAMLPVSNTSSVTNTAIKWNTSLVCLVDSTPNARIRGLPGARARKRAPATGEAVEFSYEQGSVYASNVWATTRTAP